MRLLIPALDIALRLVAIVRIKGHTALPRRVDGEGVGRVGEVDQASCRRAVGYRPRCWANRRGLVVRNLMAARCRERADVEDFIQRFLQAQRVTVGQGVRLAPLPLRRVIAERRLEVGQAVGPGELDGVGPIAVPPG